MSHSRRTRSNRMAKALSNPLFRQRIIRSKKNYNRNKNKNLTAKQNH